MAPEQAWTLPVPLGRHPVRQKLLPQRLPDQRKMMRKQRHHLLYQQACCLVYHWSVFLMRHFSGCFPLPRWNHLYPHKHINWMQSAGTAG
jgi:hypothetical protein